QWTLSKILLNESKHPVKDGEGEKEGVHWLTVLAEQGQVQAQLKLGMEYYDGTRVSKNHSEALKWLIKAAENGKIEAYNNVGLIHEKGLGVPKNPNMAFDNYRKGAERGDNKAKFNLGRLYYHGVGVDQDNVLATRWLWDSGRRDQAAKKLLEDEV